MKKLYINFSLGILLIIGALLRFYDLNWGAPFYFHPDERNIASSISNIHLIQNLNPHFFAYGSLPIYITYFVGVLANYFVSFFGNVQDIFHVSFESAIIISRFFSALLSLGTIFLLYKTARIFLNKKYSLFTTSLATGSVGLIQYAHFGTFEMYLTFFSLLLLYILLEYITSFRYRYFIYSLIVIGILCSIKISSLVLFPIPFIILIYKIFKGENITSQLMRSVFPKILASFVIGIFLLLTIFVITNPFSFLDFKSFYNSISYESDVATGSLSVFYTGTFNNTVPILFQFVYVLPFLLNPIVWIFVLPSLAIICFKSIKKDSDKLKLLIVFFLFLFIPQAILFVKWTRYMVPTLPILYLIIVIGIYEAQKLFKFKQRVGRVVFAIVILFLIISTEIWTFAFIKTVYIDPDTRISAAEEMRNLKDTSTIVLSESYDLGITPFNEIFSSINLFDFYGLETNTDLQEDLPSLVSQSDILILPSQRIVKSRILNKSKFPHGYKFYQSLLSSSQFTEIYKTPCDFWCSLLYLGDPIYGVEDTANVFDRPTVTIYRIGQ